ncbi:glycoside hydrolase family 3 C-terminal domain-containing protein [Streptomyces cocklensis]|uniref:beta-glucosidase n=1 Tax=Actinacidiphila cocklensis TaxID=887465 RepID=A0A9W4E297_9ACTN|nr:glycoside hydrolase family 3 N-terminal domain-containing protein [Actinacidiphila cocklensis]MDD1063756.1 glycoside hydrolase family 3 C-terminal domain-containing protein [Actinacidiphila cocklensis]WSX73079.1 glycoside hydrolase family 3 C-terminal domain-containing protein [Streptomyces sp. NBC_00899]WSX80855.1 glycoside hydrolase family 3 C-terminal domain-containing protein [Streptomyces sp. NBC_00899]CAG6398122.1 Beta-glucosidase [Actinacidiphila cocklensis]
MRSLLTLATAAACVAAVASVPAQAGDNPSYTNPKAPIDVRVKDLLKRMTLEEKIGQMDQISVVRMQGDCEWSGGAFTESCLKSVLVDNAAGSVLSGGGAGPTANTPANWATMVNTVQKYAIDNSRLHIPIIYGVDAVHGHNNVLGATIFPQEIGLGSTWNPELVEAAGASTARAVSATGIDWNFAPVADIARDQRWGRYYETYGEDPLLSGTLASAAVSGIQGADGAKDVAATVKHFGGYGEPGNGHDRVPGDVSLRYLQDTLLPSYKQAVDAGAMSVMVNSGAVNGIPATSSHYLLTDVLRGQWGFQGVEVSDWQDVRALQTTYHIAADYPEAIAKAVNAGLDMAMEPYDAQGWSDGLRTAVQRGLVSVNRIDQSVSRILTMKFKLGLFEHPYVDASKADSRVIGADTALARQAADESQVLLRNEGNVLPIASSAKKIVVAGSYADDINDQAGGWTVGWQGVPDGVQLPGTTVLQGIKEAAPSGTSVVRATSADDAVAKAQDADLTVVVVGEKAAAEGAADSPRPELSADQQALVKALKATGKPVVTVVVAGRPLVLGDADGTQGLLMAWLPGSEGGHAVADVLFGKVDPSGRLSASWPKDVGNEPLYYQQLPGTNGGPESTYDAAYRFGAGLSYTSYAFNSITAGSPTARTRDTISLKVGVANTGDRAGDLVVPVYVSQPTSDVLAPPTKLVAFTKVHLAAGQSTTVTVKVPPNRLAVTPGDIDGSGRQQVARGAYVFTAGTQTTTVTVR